MDYIGITVADKSKQFAVRIIKFSRFLNEEKNLENLIILTANCLDLSAIVIPI